MKKFIVAITIYLCAGCSGIPRESANISENIGLRINQARKDQFYMIDQYVEAKRESLEGDLHYNWTPDYIKDFMQSMDFQKEVCDKKGKMDRAWELQQVVEVISENVENERRRRIGALEETERGLKKSARDHYDKIEFMNNSLTNSIKAATKGKNLHNQMLKALGDPVKKAMDFDRANKELDKLIKIGGKHE